MRTDQQIPAGNQQGWRISPSLAFFIAAFCWSGFAITTWLVVEGGTAEFDTAGLLAGRIGGTLAPLGSAALTSSIKGLTELGGVPIRSLAAISAALLLVHLHRRQEAAFLGLAVIAGWIVNSGMKWIFGRARPDIVPHLTEAGGFSFPSGHSFNSAVVYFGIALAFAALSRSPAVRTAMIAGATVLSLLIAWSRVWLGVHFPSDIIAGWLAGTGWIFLAHALFSRWLNASR